MLSRANQVLLFVAVFYAFRLFLIGDLALALDEAHYWYWSNNLQLAYFDHPPMVAYMIALSTWIGGDGEFFVRLLGLLLSALTLVLLFKTVRTLAPDEPDAAWEVVFLINATLLFAAGVVIQTPDTPMIFFWAAALYAGSRIAVGRERAWWYVLGLCLGLGLLSKYTMILFVPGMFAFLVLSPEHRRLLRTKEPYLALGLALVLFTPVIYWNWQHGWLSFSFQLEHGFAAADDPAARRLVTYLGGQAGVITPLLFLAFLIYGTRGAWRAYRSRDTTYLYLSLMSWPIVLFFGMSSLMGDAASANWPAPAYLAGFALMWLVFRREVAGRLRDRWFMGAAVGLALLFTVAVHAHLVRPILPMAPRRDTTKQFHGWRELGRVVASHMEENPSAQGYFLVADRGLTTGATAMYYSGAEMQVVDFFRPQELTFLEDDIDELRGKNAILLLNHLGTDQPARYARFFEDVRLLGENTYEYRGEPLGRLHLKIYLGESFLGNWRPESALLLP